MNRRSFFGLVAGILAMCGMTRPRDDSPVEEPVLMFVDGRKATFSNGAVVILPAGFSMTFRSEPLVTASGSTKWLRGRWCIWDDTAPNFIPHAIIQAEAVQSELDEAIAWCMERRTKTNG